MYKNNKQFIARSYRKSVIDLPKETPTLRAHSQPSPKGKNEIGTDEYETVNGKRDREEQTYFKVGFRRLRTPSAC